MKQEEDEVEIPPVPGVPEDNAEEESLESDVAEFERNPECAKLNGFRPGGTA